MQKQSVFECVSNVNIAQSVWHMHLAGPTGALRRPGQFVNLQLDGLYLRRPISVYDWGDGWLEIIYKVVGRGTAQMAAMAPGAQIDTLVGLGNGFDAEASANKKTVLVGGGVGVPPLYPLARLLAAHGPVPAVVLGFRSSADIFAQQAFEALGCAVTVTTEDGSVGQQGYVTDALRGMNYDYYFTCGPVPMLRAVHTLGAEKDAEGQLSFEERMGCGFGACMGCSCHTTGGHKRVCVEGPVFASGEVVWE